MKRLRFLFTLLLVAIVSVGWASDVTFSPSDFTATTSADYSLTKDGITVAVSASTVTSSQMRIFKNKTMKISSDNATITKIEITCTASGTSQYGPGCFAEQDGYSYNAKVGTWEGSSNSVTFTASSNQVRATSIKVTYESGSSDKQNPIVAIGNTSLAPGGTTTIVTNGPALTLTSANTAVATVSNFTVTAVGEGVTTITATWEENDTYNGGSTNFTITVKDPNAGTLDNPYTVAQALTYINNLGGTTSGNVYVKGIVSGIVTAFSSQYGNISYNISDDGTTTADQLQAFRGIGLNNAKFTSAEELMVGDTVVITGQLVMYGSTPEFAANNYLVSQSRPGGTKEAAGLAYAEKSVTKYVGDDYYMHPLTNPNYLPVEYSSSDEDVATVDEDGEVTIIAKGTTTITASFAGNDNYYEGSASYTLIVKERKTYADGVLFEEKFTNIEGTGGRDGSFTGSVGNGSLSNAVYDEDDWTIGSSVYAADNSLKFGSSSNDGTMTTRSIALNGNGTLIFSAAGWGSGTNTLTVSGGNLSPDTTITLTNGEWKKYKISITGATGDLKLTFTGKRGFLDDITVSEGDVPLKQQISTIVATSDPSWKTIPKVGESRQTKPTFTVTEGTPAYFVVDASNGWWLKLNENNEWKQVGINGETELDEGTYRFRSQIRIDGGNATDYEFAENPTLTVDGEAWTKTTAVQNADDYCTVFFESPSVEVTADGKQTITHIAGTTEPSWRTIPKINAIGKAKPTFTVTEGTPAYFNVNDYNGWWQRKNADTGTWSQVGEDETLTAGTYRFHCQVRVDGDNAANYKVNETTTATVDGEQWTNIDATVDETYSYIWIVSPEITLTEADVKTQISAVAATTEPAWRTIAVKDAAAGTKPAFTITTGAPAFFNVNADNGHWQKQNADNTWTQMDDNETFAAGESYRFYCQVRIDGVNAAMYELTENLTATVDGEQWTNTDATIGNPDHSYVWFASPTVTISDGTATATYKKVTSTDDITTGQYLIVYEDGNVAFDGSRETLDAVSNTIAVTISNNEIEVNETTVAAEFTIDATANTIKSASGYYIGQTSDANGLASNATTTYTNTISFDDDGNANVVASGGAYLRYNATANQARFRYYKSSSYSNQKAIQLYKKVESSTPGTIEAPTFSPTGGEVAYGTEVYITQPNAAMIVYTLDGTDPSFNDDNGEIFADAIIIKSDVTIKAIAVDNDGNESSVASATYTVLRPSAPIFTPAGGDVEAGTEVTITQPDAAMILYTTDGSDPSYENNNGEVYGSPITVNADMTIKAIAVDDNEIESAVASAVYTVAVPGVTKNATFDFTTENAYGMTTLSGSDQDYNPNPMTFTDASHKVTMTLNGNTRHWYAASTGNHLRLYKGSTFTVAAPEGAYITKIELTGNVVATLTADNGTLDAGVWEGKANSITFTPTQESGNKTLTYVDVTYRLPLKDTELTVTNLRYATMYNGDFNLRVPEGVKASTYIVSDDKLVPSMTYTTGMVIPAGVAVVVEANTDIVTSEDFGFKATTDLGSHPNANMLCGSDYEYTDEEEGYMYYILTTPNDAPNDASRVGFFWQGRDNNPTNGLKVTNAAHKAYLKVPMTTAGNAKGWAFGDGEATGISTVDGLTSGQVDESWYTLDGQKLNGQPTQKGIYLRNGRKVIIK